MKFRSYRRQVMADIKKRAERKALKVVNAVRTQIITGMAGSKTGREYRVPGTKRKYTASAPGEYPAIRTGQLRANIKLAVLASGMNVYGIIGTNIKHGIILEGGDSADGIRPWLSKGFEDAAAEIERILKEPL